jgi:hypothetical protein
MTAVRMDGVATATAVKNELVDRIEAQGPHPSGSARCWWAVIRDRCFNPAAGKHRDGIEEARYRGRSG